MAAGAGCVRPPPAGSPGWYRVADKAALVRDDDELGPVAGAKFHHGAVDVRLGGRRAEHQVGGDLVVGQSRGDEGDNLPFPVGERRELPRLWLCRQS